MAIEYTRTRNRSVEYEGIMTESKTTWQPIETAPKDGQLILGWNRNFGRHIVYWGCQPEHNPHHFWIAASCRINHIDQPDLWTELPDAPGS